MKASDYKRLTQEEHVRTISDTYIGSDQAIERTVRLFDGERFRNAEITLPEAIEFLFLEIVSNAGDNVIRSKEKGVKPGSVQISMNGTQVLVENGGLPIPVEIHPEYKVYVPELIFGNLLTSSNYGVERKGGGRNGMGCKLVNLYSKSFGVEIGDSVRKLIYTQEWGNLMKERGEPNVAHYAGKKSYVKVLYELDLSRFGYESYPDEAISLFAAHAADLSLTTKAKTIFNGLTFHFKRIDDYAKLFGVENTAGYKNKEGTVELCLMDTETANVVSFANTKLTRQGGTHVEGVYKGLTGLLKMMKGKNITLREIKPQLSFVLNVQVVDPHWSDQMKTGLKFPDVKIALPDSVVRKMLNWDLVKRLCMTSEAKVLAQTDGKKRKHLKIVNLQDANYAGTKKGSECSLYVVEGLSASGYAELFRDNLGGKDYIGTYPLRGKLLNVMNANNLRIADSKVIGKLKEVLGLKEGLDYRTPSNYNSLRYGHVFVLCDSDSDSKHIIGLILNFFYCRFPSLLQIGFVKYFRTPIIRLKKGKTRLNFFTEDEYILWQESNPDYSAYDRKYLKGLGSSSPAEVKDDSKDPRVVVCVYDDNTAEAMKLAFDKDLSDTRKGWIEQFQRDTFGIYSIEGISEQPISDFINQELLDFSLCNMLRSIPRLIDGLKISQRKIIWGSMDQWKNWHSGKKFTSMKVKQLSSKVSLFTAYKHSEDCLSETIILMAQDFVGSNNMPYFYQDGIMGFRSFAGENSANPRYSYTYPEGWWRYVFKKEDVPLLSLIEDEGLTVEPSFLLPIIPMCLVNGCQGIGTGYSTSLPNYNPLEIVEWLEKRLSGDTGMEELLPWYRGFEGDILVRDKTMITVGKFHTQGDTVVVTEIPIGKSIQKFVDHLKTLIESKEIKDYDDKSTANTPLFHIYGMKKPTYKKLKLEKSFGLTNMVLLGLDDRPRRYSSVSEILENFFESRLAFYEKRKDKQLEMMMERRAKIGQKIRLILAVLDGEVVVNNRKKDDVSRDLYTKGIDPGLLKEVNLFHLTAEEVQRLRKEDDDLRAVFEAFEKKPFRDIWLDELREFKAFWLKGCE